MAQHRAIRAGTCLLFPGGFAPPDPLNARSRPSTRAQAPQLVEGRGNLKHRSAAWLTRCARSLSANQPSISGRGYGQSERRQNFAGHEVGEIVKRFGIVERGHRGRYHRARLRAEHLVLRCRLIGARAAPSRAAASLSITSAAALESCAQPVRHTASVSSSTAPIAIACAVVAALAIGARDPCCSGP